jgi:hypothetical protein
MASETVCTTTELISDINKLGGRVAEAVAEARVLFAIIEFFKKITSFIMSSFICFENYKIGILDILNKFISIKNETEIIETEKTCTNDGYIVMGTFAHKFSMLPKIFYQNITQIDATNTNTNTNEKINVLRLDIPIQEIGFIINHTIDELFNILLTANKYNTNTKYIEAMILDKFHELFKYSKDNYNINFIPQNNLIFQNRIFGSGKNYCKVKDEQMRDQLILLDTNNNRFNNYVDQNNNNNNDNKYDYPLLFYIKGIFPQSILDNIDNILNKNNIDNIIDSMNTINNFELVNKIINKLFISPETSELVRFKKYRHYASVSNVGIAFNHQLIKEQMASVFNNTEWSLHNIKLWTLDELSNERDNNSQSCLNIFKEQLYNIHTSRVPAFDENISKNFKIPSNKEACYNFHNIFTKGLLDFNDAQIEEFYSDNLIVGGSAFAFSACSHRTDNNNYFEHYNGSDVDCPILAGDNVYLSVNELEKIVDEKIKILQKYYPGGWSFVKTQVEKRFQIHNNHNSTVLELFSVPYSRETVWKHFAKYHFGWVRGFFDGHTWFILPSGVISVCTRLSIDIRYCATKHAPHELIYKYLKRGFIPILNKKEMLSLDKYIYNIHNDRMYNYIIMEYLYREPIFAKFYQKIQYYYDQNNNINTIDNIYNTTIKNSNF